MSIKSFMLARYIEVRVNKHFDKMVNTQHSIPTELRFDRFRMTAADKIITNVGRKGTKPIANW